MGAPLLALAVRVLEEELTMQLSIISTPLPSGTAPPKKVRKIVLESGVPSSLRGKVWAWFMSSQMSARVPGLYQELLDHDKGQADEQIERDVATWVSSLLLSSPVHWHPC